MRKMTLNTGVTGSIVPLAHALPPHDEIMTFCFKEEVSADE